MNGKCIKGRRTVGCAEEGKHPDHQSSAVFSFSLDAVLLADFAELPRVKPAKIVDLCAGNGAVSFLLTGKTKNPVIGVELEDRLVDMARRTVHAVSQACKRWS